MKIALHVIVIAYCRTNCTRKNKAQSLWASGSFDISNLKGTWTDEFTTLKIVKDAIDHVNINHNFSYKVKRDSAEIAFDFIDVA